MTLARLKQAPIISSTYQTGLTGIRKLAASIIPTKKLVQAVIICLLLRIYVLYELELFETKRKKKAEKFSATLLNKMWGNWG